MTEQRPDGSGTVLGRRVGACVQIFAIAAAIPLATALLRASGLSGTSSLALAYLVLAAGGLAFVRARSHVAGAHLYPANRRWQIGIRAGAVAVGLATIWLMFLEPVSRISQSARGPLDVLGVALLGPVAEEILFRGVIWILCLGLVPARAAAWRRTLVPLAASSLLFGAMHLGYWWVDGQAPTSPDALTHAGSMVIAGAIFGAVRVASKSLGGPLLVHAAANCAVLASQVG